jgi:hypothetical protein
VFVAKITDEFIPGLDVLHSNYTLTDFGCHVLWLGKEEVTYWCPKVWPLSFHPHKGWQWDNTSSLWESWLCSPTAPLDARKIGKDRDRTRMPIQPSMLVPIKVNQDCCVWKHTMGKPSRL